MQKYRELKIISVTAIAAISLTYAVTKFSSSDILQSICAGTAAPITAPAKKIEAAAPATSAPLPIADWHMTPEQSAALTAELAKVPQAGRFQAIIWPRPGGAAQITYAEDLRKAFEASGWLITSSSPSNYLAQANDGLSLVVAANTSIDNPINANAQVLRKALLAAKIPHKVATDTRLESGGVGFVVGGQVQ